MRSLVLLLSLFIIGGCSPRKEERPDTQNAVNQHLEAECIARSAAHKWFDTFQNAHGERNAPLADNPPLVSLVVHGLNNHPGIMDSLIAQLNSSFIPALRLSLSGHEPAEEMANSATVDRWRCDIDQGLKQLRNRYPKSAIVGIGFSLGGTLLADAIVRTNPSPLTGLVLLAPAIKFTWRGTAIRMLSVLRAFGVALKSKSLAAYRAHDETPLSAYHALFALASGLTRQSSAEPLVTIPALVLVSPKDELISMTGLSLWIEENELARWKLESITPRASIEGSYQHLIVDEPSLGSEEWHRVKDILDLFLKSIAEQQCANQLLRETRIPAAANLQ